MISDNCQQFVCQCRFKIVRNAEENLSFFGGGGGNKIKRFLTQIEYLQFAVSGA